MGTRPTFRENTPGPKARQRLGPAWIIGALAAVSITVTLFRLQGIRAAKHGPRTFDDFVKQKEDGSYELRSARLAARDRGLERLREEAEQYVLLARENGEYPCAHCPEGKFYLQKNEVAKVGVTLRGAAGRYTQKFYADNRLRYLVEYRGSLQEALEREFLRLIDYPLTPENLARPDKPDGGLLRYKLGRPPLNPVDR